MPLYLGATLPLPHFRLRHVNSETQCRNSEAPSALTTTINGNSGMQETMWELSVRCTLYIIYRIYIEVLTPRELKNQVVNLHCFVGKNVRKSYLLSQPH
jgi:hypothetical protein